MVSEIETDDKRESNAKDRSSTTQPKAEAEDHGKSARASSKRMAAVPTPGNIVEAFQAGTSGYAIPQGFLDLCRIESDWADEPLSSGMGQFLGIFSDVLAKHEVARRMVASGWIPHPVIPIWQMMGPEKDSKKVCAAVTEYVNGNREELYTNLLNRFTSYRVEPDGCDLAKQAISAHRAGLFRLIVPSVFPEIERCARSTLGLGVKSSGKQVIDNLIEQIGKLPISEMDAFLASEALELMDRQIYQSLQGSGDYTPFQEMPHRHGSQHGLFVYKSSRDALNALFLLDFVLMACTAIAKLAAR